jgi:hypothetical protein
MLPILAFTDFYNVRHISTFYNGLEQNCQESVKANIFRLLIETVQMKEQI